jgi:hypothetical protein
MQKRNTCRILVRNPEGKRPLEDLDVGGRVISKLILEKCGGVLWTEFFWLRIGTSDWIL